MQAFQRVNWLRVISLLLVAALIAFLIHQNLRDSLRHVTLSTRTTLTVPRPDDGRLFLLSGFPAYRSFEIPLPIDSGPEKGLLRLPYSAQLAQNANGLLRIKVNGALRAERVLSAGQSDDTLTLELTPEELSTRQLKVSLALLGDSGLGPCGEGRDQAATLALKAGAGADLFVAESITSLLDSWTLLARPYRLPLDGRRTGASATELTYLAVRLRQERLDANLVDHPAPGDGLGALRIVDGDTWLLRRGSGRDLHVTRRAIDWLPHLFANRQVDLIPLLEAGRADRVYDLLAQRMRHRWPLTLHDLGADDSLLPASEDVRWTVNFLRSDLPAGALPNRLTLNFETDGLQGTWQYYALLNGELLDSRQLSSQHFVDLAGATIRPRNRLEILARRLDATASHCQDTSEGFIRLAATSVLEGLTLTDVERARSPLETVIAQLESSPRLPIRFGATLSATEMNRATDLLAAVLPDGTALVDGDQAGYGLNAMAINRAAARLLPAALESRPRWLLQPRDPQALGGGGGGGGSSGDGFDSYQVTRLRADLATEAYLSDDAVGILFHVDQPSGRPNSTLFVDYTTLPTAAQTPARALGLSDLDDYVWID